MRVELMFLTKEEDLCLLACRKSSVPTPTQPRGPERMWFSEHCLPSPKGVTGLENLPVK
jgi:hypothetical protein